MLNLKTFREHLGISQAEMARRLDISRQTYNNYELGKREADYEMLLKMAEIFNISVGALLYDDVESEDSLTKSAEYRGFNILNKHNIYMIPIYQTVSAGYGAYADDYIIGYEPVYLNSLKEAEETFAVVVKGDSMLPKIEEDDIAIVHKQNEFQNGDIIIVLDRDKNEGYIKRGFLRPNKLTLESFNPNYPTISFSDSELDNIIIVGVVKKIIKSV